VAAADVGHPGAGGQPLVTPSSAGIQSWTSWWRYSGAKMRSTPRNSRGSCSCQPTPSPVRNASTTRSALAHAAAMIGKTPGDVRGAVGIGQHGGVLIGEFERVPVSAWWMTYPPDAWLASHSRT
jgi:hypothetical protein